VRILIAEDERITRRSLQRQLEKWGHEVVAAEDGAEAWEHFQKHPCDIVVTDWDMPRLDGRELVERIRGSDASGYVYLIMLTGRAEKADLVTGMEAGADDFLAKPFDQNELRVRLDAGERIIRLERTLAAQNLRMKGSLDAAADVQRSLLPKDLPETLGANFAWHYEPCDELGGDILNVLPLDDRHVALYLLDVTGHGVPAALLSVTLSRMITTRGRGSSLLIDDVTNPEGPVIRAPRKVIEQLNDQFPMATQGNRFFTMVYGVMDTQTGVLNYTLAGQPPPVLVRRGRPAEQLGGTGFPVGVVTDPDFDEYNLDLEPGDRVFFYSDGITEARNQQASMLGAEGLVRLIDACRDLSLHECLAACLQGLRDWSGPVPFDDDISMLAVEMPST
jgi:sigma-B regulation protein RsbU (phosphoserine phosphatase)